MFAHKSFFINDNINQNCNQRQNNTIQCLSKKNDFKRLKADCLCNYTNQNNQSENHFEFFVLHAAFPFKERADGCCSTHR